MHSGDKLLVCFVQSSELIQKKGVTHMGGITIQA